MRLIVFDEDAAGRAASRLRREGYDAHVRRERLAGEDDDEDHPWAVLSDAPEPVLDLLADELDGWLDTDEPAGPATPPLPPPDLPTAPRRLKRDQPPGGAGAPE
ncbi:hypothetical protein [Nocardioides taihuensis]|uniref:Uncharacterized protein n=1 Tax=Nocardioides taihuensis TaxID=1835606 RepID=A0ABW0BJG6_9ACTN